MVLYPRPDYLSSSRKRLVPQLLYKGGILKSWGKKQAVAVQRSFYQTLPMLPQVTPEQADIVWLIYDLEYNFANQVYTLVLTERIYSRFEPALDRISRPVIGPIQSFIDVLQTRLDVKLTGAPPDAPTVLEITEPDVADREEI